MQGRLNLFQSAMLRWRELHPYCAAHAIAIEAPLDEARLRKTIAGVLEACGLTGWHLDADRRRYEFAGGPATPELRLLEGGEAPFDAAAREIATSINLPFPRSGRYDPFRFFAIRSQPGFVLGVVYDHVIAGGDSIAVLLTDVADRYVAARPEDAPLPLLERYPATYGRLFARHAAHLARGILAVPSLVAGWRRAARPRLEVPEDGTNGFVRFAVPAGDLARARASARAWGVTTNDVLLAMLFEAVAPLTGRRATAARRREIALASIVNVRADFERPAAEVFGQFLSSLRVLHAVPPGLPLADLAKAVAAQTSRAKAGKLYLVTLLAIGIASLLWPFASAGDRHRMYLKYHPVFAGLTPLNVNALRRRGASRDGDYLRAASTGPMSPMVVAVTTAGAALQVGITYRTTALARADVDGVVRAIVERMGRL